MPWFRWRPAAAWQKKLRTPSPPTTSGGGALRQRDRDVQHVVLAVLHHVDLDRVGIDVDVLADHLEQLAAQQRQVIGAAGIAALLRDDDAQAILGDRSGVLLDLEEIEHAHVQPPKSLLKKPFFSSWMKRIGRASPIRRATASS